jgi:hypothetical protein
MPCRAPQSYHDILVADRTFHNPHAVEEMAGAYGLAKPQAQHRCVCVFVCFAYACARVFVCPLSV